MKVPLRRVATIEGGGTPTAHDENWGGPVPFVTPPDLRPVVGRVIESTTRSLTEVGAARGSNIVPANSVILSIRAPIGYVARTAHPVSLNQGCRALTGLDETRARFLTYALIAASDELAALGRGTTFQEISASQLATLEVPSPPLTQQRAIADYLDRETAQIDTLIEAQQQTLELIDERRQSRLAAAFATLPRTSSISRLAGLDALHDGDWVESKDQDPNGEVRLLQLADVGDGVFKDRSDRRLNLETFERLGCSYVLPGDILIARLPDPIGRACIVPEGLGPTNTVVDVAVLRVDPTKVDRRFAMFAINETQTRSAIEALQGGATRQRVARRALGRVPVARPDLAVQRAVADRLERSLGKLDELAREAIAFIELSKERRAALVAAAVTGQIDLDAAS